MKVTFLIVAGLIIFSVASGQSKHFRIDGVINGLANGSVKILYAAEDTSIHVFEDSAILDNGKFIFTGLTAHPFGAYIYHIGVRRSDLFIIDPGEQSIIINNDSFYLRPKSSAASNSEFINNYLPLFVPVQDKLDKFNAEILQYTKENGSGLSKYLIDNVDSLREDFREQKNRILYKYVTQYPNSYSVFWSMYYALEMRGYAKVFDSVFQMFDQTIQNSSIGRVVAEKLSRSRSTAIGSIFPKFILKDQELKKLSLSDKLNQKYILVDFWFHNCGPCIQEFAQLRAVYKRYHSVDFEIIGISTDKISDRDNWLKAIRIHNLNWPQYWDADGLESRKYSINSFPSNFLIDRYGKIILKNISPLTLTKFLEKNISKH